jgi:hypothetical protein
MLLKLVSKERQVSTANKRHSATGADGMMLIRNIHSEVFQRITSNKSTDDCHS